MRPNNVPLYGLAFRARRGRSCGQHGKLICLRDPKLDPKRIPMPFAANDHIIPVGDMPGLIAALALKGTKPHI
jgi:hypothetical protein